MREKVQGISVAANPMSSENIPNIFFEKKKKNFNPYNKHFYIQDKKFYILLCSLTVCDGSENTDSFFFFLELGENPLYSTRDFF